MSSPFNIKKTSSVGRNGFDLSQRHLFGAVPGMLLPIMHEECIPGDTFRINLDSFTRMRPLNTAAFARFKEYFDFYYCSKDTLWPYYNQMVVNNNEPVAMPNMNYTNAPNHVPRIKNTDITQFIADNREVPVNDDMGVNLGDGTAILMDLLGCGDFKFTYEQTVGGQTTDGLWLSMLPWAMYQQIYANFYRNPQWERRDVVSYNLRQFYSGGDYTSAQFALIAPHLLKMRYANWHKDYFMGLYPTQQFGDVSVVSSVGNTLSQYSLTSSNNFLKTTTDGKLITSTTSGTNGVGTSLVSDMSIVDLRRAQALQRWKEVTMTNGSSMYQQVKAHYGFELPEGRKDAPEFIGGMDNIVVINDVDATASGWTDATATDNAQSSRVGQVFGKAAAASDIRKTIEFTAKDFGYIMCIYHVEPLLEYDAVGVKASNLHLEAADEFIPEFDKIGFGSLRMQELMFWDTSDSQGSIVPSTLLGYTSRYLDRKCSYDRVHGSFMQNGNVNDKAWTVALSWQYLYSLFESASSNPIDFRFFKVNPFIANNIMQVQIPTEHEGTPLLSQIQGYEPFMCSASFKIYKTSNMSVDSLPY